MKALILSASPRRNGNSAALARAAATGLAEAGHNANFVYADDILASFLKDCRRCRRTDGECAIGDGFRSVFLDEFLPAEGFVAATPIYWYGMSCSSRRSSTACFVISPRPIRAPRGHRADADQAHWSHFELRRNLSDRLSGNCSAECRNTPATRARHSSALFTFWQCAGRCGKRPSRSARRRSSVQAGLLHASRDGLSDRHAAAGAGVRLNSALSRQQTNGRNKMGARRW